MASHLAINFFPPACSDRIACLTVTSQLGTCQAWPAWTIVGFVVVVAVVAVVVVVVVVVVAAAAVARLCCVFVLCLLLLKIFGKVRVGHTLPTCLPILP